MSDSRPVAPVPSPAELLGAPERAMDLPRHEAATLLAIVGALEAVLRARLASPDAGVELSASMAMDRVGIADRGLMLTAHEAATIARVHPRVIYGWSRRMDWHAFAHRLSRKVLRIEDRAFRRWLDRQGAR